MFSELSPSDRGRRIPIIYILVFIKDSYLVISKSIIYEYSRQLDSGLLMEDICIGIDADINTYTHKRIYTSKTVKYVISS